MPITSSLAAAVVLITVNAERAEIAEKGWSANFAISAFELVSAGAATPVVAALPPMIVNVSPALNVPPSLVTHVLAEAHAIWRAEGFTFVWQRPPAANREFTESAEKGSFSADSAVSAFNVRSDRSVSRLPSMLHVSIGNDTGRSRGRSLPLGWIGFDDGRPEPEIVVSYANAGEFMESARGVVGDMNGMPRAQRETLLGRAMGRALAHELAHYLLETKVHTLTGLLQATRSAQELFAADRSRFRLDARQRTQIAARLRREAVVARR